ncbi:MAG: YceI family protein [Candidatus Omnitrophica bacterium]|nr:YceI family protein [Candidatus Omnitrophota bacterium]
MNTIPVNARGMIFQARQVARVADDRCLLNPFVHLTVNILEMSARIADRLSVSRLFFLSALILFLLPASIQARQIYQIDSQASLVECVIRYTVIGEYKPRFRQFQGLIDFDPREVSESSVVLSIDLNSLVSSHGTLDRIAKSSRMLDVRSFPYAEFKSQIVNEYKDHYYVTGLLNFHGIVKELGFPFHLYLKEEHGKTVLNASGRWILNRKDFGVYWHKWLDHGGVIVSNKVSIDWNVIATLL